LIVIIIEALEIKIVNRTDEFLDLKIPPYRVDVKREIDVIEEILRIYGYNNIQIPEKLNTTLSYSQKPDKEKIQNLISDLLSNNGFNEMMSNSLTKSEYYNKESFKDENTVKILNPLSKDLNAMRQTLLFGALESVIYNSNRKNSDIKLYEFGNVYQQKASLTDNSVGKFQENKHLAIVLSGYHDDEHWKNEKNEADFFHVKAYVELVLQRLGLNIDELKSTFISNDIFSEGLSKTYKNTELVQLGLVNNKILKEFGIDFNVFYADFNWDNILKLLKNIKFEFTNLPKHPEVRRDLSLLLDENITFAELKQLALKLEKNLIKKVDLFDFYKGDKIEKGKKSYAISFIIQDDDKTLTDKQIEKIMGNIQFQFEKQFGAKLR
jgi:phenylalanyl-tRNA synthetase beta chain